MGLCVWVSQHGRVRGQVAGVCFFFPPCREDLRLNSCPRAFEANDFTCLAIPRAQARGQECNTSVKTRRKHRLHVERIAGRWMVTESSMWNNRGYQGRDGENPASLVKCEHFVSKVRYRVLGR